MNGEYKIRCHLFQEPTYDLLDPDSGEVVGRGETVEDACLDACVQCWIHRAVVDEVVE